MKKRIFVACIPLCFFLYLGIGLLIAQEQKVNLYLRDSYSERFDKYFPVHPEVREYLAVTDTGVNVYASPADRAANLIEYRISWDELAVFRALVKQNPQKAFELYQQKKSPENEINTLKRMERFQGWNNLSFKPLTNLRVAIDPGHLGGDIEIARVERRFIEMNLGKGEKISFHESELTFATALFLKSMLEGLGATVVLTRKEANLTAFGITFEEWYDNLEDSQKEGGSKKDKMQHAFEKYFKRTELAERARIINEFQPDLTVIIHYNATGENKKGDPPVKEDFNEVFVGGGFLRDELDTPNARFNLLRLLLSDDLEGSIEFSKYVLDSFTSILKVPVNGNVNRNNSLPTEVKGVFARNLTLTTKVYGTLCFGESLYQNNELECRLLNKRDVEIGGIKTSSRVQEVAKAYFEAIVNYVKKQY